MKCRYNDEEIIQLLKENKTYKEIQNTTGCSCGYIINLIKKYNLPRRRKNYDPNIENLMMGHDYWLIKDENNPMANKKGYVPYHRYVMSKYLGRPLKKEEIVHHINENKLDNRIENLKIMTINEHAKLHSKQQPKGYHRNLDENKVKKLYLKGYSGRQIAEKLGSSKTIVLNVIKKLGISRPRIKDGSTQNKNGKIEFKSFSKINENELRNLYFNNLTLNEIKEKIGCSYADLVKKIKELGLKREPITIRNEKGKFERKG